MLTLFINWNPSPEIFTIPGIDWPVRWYGLMWALAFIGSHFFMNRIYRTEGRTEKELDTLFLTFNHYIFSDYNTKNILEEVIYTISLSVKDNYDVENIVFKADDKEIYKSVIKILENN